MKMKPILISGIGRSGTSALIKALTRHKDVLAPNDIGEAPFIHSFLKFLNEYQYNSPQKSYHLANYKIDEACRKELFHSLMMKIQYGDSDFSKNSELYWVAKVSLPLDLYKIALEIFGEVRTVHIVRNGIEVVNSSMSFHGFKDMSFEALCNRWVSNSIASEHFRNEPLCAVIRHNDMVTDPEGVFGGVFKKINIDEDDSVAGFIRGNLFNSSFDKNNAIDDPKKVFQNRLKCWDDWSPDNQEKFIEICDQHMKEYGFERPYANKKGISSRVVSLPSEENNQLPDASIDLKMVGNEVDNKDLKRRHIDIEPKIRHVSNKVDSMLNGKMTPVQFDYHVNYSKINNYLFIENPKVPSSDLLSILIEKEKKGALKTMDSVYNKKMSPIDGILNLSISEQNEILFDGDVYRFATVRNPYTSLLSTYLNRIAKPLSPKRELLAFIENKNINEIEIESSREISFKEFIEAVCCLQTDFQKNVHWMPQYKQIMADTIEYDDLVYYENFNQDLDRILKKIFPGENFSNAIGVQKIGENNLLSYYTDELLSMVGDSFKDDFEFFGYSYDIGCLLPSNRLKECA